MAQVKPVTEMVMLDSAEWTTAVKLANVLAQADPRVRETLAAVALDLAAAADAGHSHLFGV